MLFNPLDVTQAVALLLVARWCVSASGPAAVQAPARRVGTAVFGGVVFVALNAVLLRALHHYGAVDYNATALPWQPAYPAQSGSRSCGVWLVALLVFIAGWWLYSMSGNCGGAKTYGEARDLRCALPGGGEPREKQNMADLRAGAMQPVQGYLSHSTASSGAADPSGTLTSTANVAFPSGAPFLDGAFEPSDTTAEFYNTFNPQSLSQMMPSNWRQDGESCKSLDADKGQFSQFSRYSISPDKVKKSEGMRGMMRLRENTMTTNSKTLGMPNLLLNAVHPLRATPIGANQFIFQDSQLRQAYIAAATGSFPTETSC